MDVTREWWMKNCILPEEGVGKEEIKGEDLTNVMFVKVRDKKGRPHCDVYGDVSFKVGDTEVKLYSRNRDNSDLLDLTDYYDGSYLSLSDRHESDRPPPPLGAVSASNRLWVKMKLYEKGSTKDKLIANTERYHSADEGDEEVDSSYYFVVPGKHGYEFVVCYSVVFGARAEVEVLIKEGEGGGGFSNGKIPFWGKIAAYQFLEDLPPHFSTGISVTSLINIDRGHAVTLNAGESFALNRRFVVVPMRYDKYLAICITPRTGEVTPAIDEVDEAERVAAAKHYLYFPLSCVTEGVFSTNKNRTHSKHFKHSSGIEFHASIKFCP